MLGSILGPSWGSFSVMLAPFSAQVGPGTVFEPSYLRKVILHEILRLPILLGSSGSNMASPKRPRSFQDCSLIVLDRFFSTLDFRFDCESFSAPVCVVWEFPNGPPGPPSNCANRPPGGSLDDLGVVLTRFLLGLPVSDRFCTFFGSSWCHFWPVVVPFSVFKALPK